MTKRKCYSDGRRLNWFYAGPPVCVEHPLGTFVEDYEYVCKLGDLDEFNGRGKLIKQSYMRILTIISTLFY